MLRTTLEKIIEESEKPVLKVFWIRPGIENEISCFSWTRWVIRGTGPAKEKVEADSVRYQKKKKREGGEGR